ncbi:DUF6758 family protein [Angustibacter aerolatus]
MSADVRCPRCLEPARAPGLASSRWSCARHGAVAPLHPPVLGDARHLRATAERSRVPVWVPWPLSRGWVATGVQRAGDDHEGTVGVAVSVTGPNAFRRDGDPLAADVLVVAEQPGVGFGARLAGLDDVDPGSLLEQSLQGEASRAVAHVPGQRAPLWWVPAPDDRAVYVGEAASVWLWVVVRPAAAGALVLDGLHLVDLRDPGYAMDVPSGALTPHLV